MFHGRFGNCVRSHQPGDSDGDRLGSQVMEKMKIVSLDFSSLYEDVC